LDGGVDRGAAKVAKGRKEEGVSEGGVSEFRSFRVSEFQSFRVSEFQSFRVSEFQSFRVSEFQSFIFISTHLRESSSSAVKKSKCAAQEEGVSEDGFSERWIQLN
jgi:hypothetical protein